MNAVVRTPLILMAEDDSDDRLLAREALEESGFAAELRFVENGAELMDYLLARNRFGANGDAPPPSLILLDLNMPRKDGREVLKELKADPSLSQIPVVVFTTSRADTDVASIYRLGANSFISKPTAFESLVKVMRTLGQYWFEVVLLPIRN